jgi:hypothetical protein
MKRYLSMDNNPLKAFQLLEKSIRNEPITLPNNKNRNNSSSSEKRYAQIPNLVVCNSVIKAVLNNQYSPSNHHHHCNALQSQNSAHSAEAAAKLKWTGTPPPPLPYIELERITYVCQQLRQHGIHLWPDTLLEVVQALVNDGKISRALPLIDELLIAVAEDEKEDDGGGEQNEADFDDRGDGELHLDNMINVNDNNTLVDLNNSNRSMVTLEDTNSGLTALHTALDTILIQTAQTSTLIDLPHILHRYIQAGLIPSSEAVIPIIESLVSCGHWDKAREVVVWMERNELDVLPNHYEAFVSGALKNSTINSTNIEARRAMVAHIDTLYKDMVLSGNQPTLSFFAKWVKVIGLAKDLPRLKILISKSSVLDRLKNIDSSKVSVNVLDVIIDACLDVSVMEALKVLDMQRDHILATTRPSSHSRSSSNDNNAASTSSDEILVSTNTKDIGATATAMNQVLSMLSIHTCRRLLYQLAGVSLPEAIHVWTNLRARRDHNHNANTNNNVHHRMDAFELMAMIRVMVATHENELLKASSRFIAKRYNKVVPMTNGFIRQVSNSTRDMSISINIPSSSYSSSSTGSSSRGGTNNTSSDSINHHHHRDQYKALKIYLMYSLARSLPGEVTIVSSKKYSPYHLKCALHHGLKFHCFGFVQDAPHLSKHAAGALLISIKEGYDLLYYNRESSTSSTTGDSHTDNASSSSSSSSSSATLLTGLEVYPLEMLAPPALVDTMTPWMDPSIQPPPLEECLAVLKEAHDRHALTTTASYYHHHHHHNHHHHHHREGGEDEEGTFAHHMAPFSAAAVAILKYAKYQDLHSAVAIVKWARQCRGYRKSVEHNLKKLALLAGRGHEERREIERMLLTEGAIKGV